MITFFFPNLVQQTSTVLSLAIVKNVTLYFSFFSAVLCPFCATQQGNNKVSLLCSILLLLLSACVAVSKRRHFILLIFDKQHSHCFYNWQRHKQGSLYSGGHQSEMRKK